MKKLIAFVICMLSSFGIHAQGFLSSPLSCGDPCVYFSIHKEHTLQE